MIARELLSRLKNVRTISGGWMACCPSHDDMNPSLSVSERKGKILLKCQAGCETPAVVAALGLSMRDLFTEPKSNGHGRSIVAKYPYTDESGKLLFQVVRFEPKGFSQRRPDGKGGWIWNLNGVRRVLYNLPAVLDPKAKAILVLEGEKDCEAARKLGLVATCCPHGAGKWRPEYNGPLKEKRVAIVADADPPGLAHARDVARSLMGVAESVRLIEALPQGKDLAEWVECGATNSALVRAIQETPELTPADVEKWAKPQAEGGFQLTRLGDLMEEPEEQVSWLLEGVLPAGGLSLLAAKPKTGKSTLSRCLALAVARGERFLERETQKGAVIYLALEEKRSEVRAHFRAMGATGQEQIFIHAASAPADALLSITVEVKRHRPVLLIIDPALRFVRLKDSNDYAQVTAALEPILALARENGCHTLLVHHLGKGERSEATDGILGSTALFAAVDTALVMKRSEKYRTLQSRQRYGEDLAESVMLFDPESRTLSLGSERAEVDKETAEKAILSFLEGRDPQDRESIEKEIEGRTTHIRRAIKALVEAGSVLQSGSGKRGDPFLFSCSHIYTGTTKQETQKGAETRMNSGGKVVPEKSQKSFLVPAGKEGPEGPISGSENQPGLAAESGPDMAEV